MVKRHKQWEAITKPVCRQCFLDGHVDKYFVRYFVPATPEEKCKCPCGRHDVKNDDDGNVVPRENEVAP